MQWHELLGAVLIDFFDGSPYVVETEVDLSLRKQYLDIVVIRKKEGDFQRLLPDGFTPLANHNLISFKSHQDTFDSWTVQELTGIVDNLISMYRKEDTSMATTLEELNQKLLNEALEKASVKDLLKRLTVAQRLEGLPTEEIEAFLRSLKQDRPQENP